VSKLLTKGEIRRALLRYRYDPALNRARWGNGVMDVPLTRVADLAGMPRGKRDLHDFISGMPMPNWAQRKLSPIIEGIESGRIRLVFRQLRKGVCKSWGGHTWEIEHHSPPSGPIPRLDKLMPAADWKPFAACRHCGGRSWESVVIRDGFHYACRSCCGSAYWPALGARRTTRQERAGLPEMMVLEDYGVDAATN
jgi:hypothetical protein